MRLSFKIEWEFLTVARTHHRIRSIFSNSASAKSVVIVSFVGRMVKKLVVAAAPRTNLHFKRRFMINQARQTLCLGQTARILIYIYVRVPNMTRCPYLYAYAASRS